MAAPNPKPEPRSEPLSVEDETIRQRAYRRMKDPEFLELVRKTRETDPGDLMTLEELLRELDAKP